MTEEERYEKYSKRMKEGRREGGQGKEVVESEGIGERKEEYLERFKIFQSLTKFARSIVEFSVGDKGSQKSHMCKGRSFNPFFEYEKR